MNFIQHIRHGDHADYQKSLILDYLSNLIINENSEYTTTIKPYRKSKTLEQLGYYFSSVVPTAMEWQGLIKDDADMWLRKKMVKPRHIEIMGETFEIRPSIAKMKIKEMSSYIDDCINFLGSHGQYVAPPTYTE